VDILLTSFTHHDAFDLRSLEGVFIVFAGPCLMEKFGRTRLSWAYLGRKAHWLDTMAYTLDCEDIL
jgi:hypothetical protein